MPWAAVISYLVAGGIGTLVSATVGIWFLIVLTPLGRWLLIFLALVALSLVIAGIMGMFSPGKAATLAFRASVAGLAVNAIGAVLQVMGSCLLHLQRLMRPMTDLTRNSGCTG